MCCSIRSLSFRLEEDRKDKREVRKLPNLRRVSVTPLGNRNESGD